MKIELRSFVIQNQEMIKLRLNLLIIFLIPLFHTIIPVSSEFNFFYEYCDNEVGNYTTDSTYQENINLLLPDLTDKASLSIFDTHTVGEGINQIYGLYMCRGDLDDTQCHDCIKDASSSIVEKCPVQKEAIVWYQECMVRYANRDIFSHKEEGPVSYSWSTANVSNSLEFGKTISETVEDLISQVAYNTSMRGYGVKQRSYGVDQEVFVLAQCTPDILGRRCDRCLRASFRDMGACCGTARVRLAIYMPSCWLRYANATFIGVFNTSPPTDDRPTLSFPPPSGRQSPALDFPPPSPDVRRSEGTISTHGGISFVFGHIMTLIVSLCMAW